MHDGFVCVYGFVYFIMSLCSILYIGLQSFHGIVMKYVMFFEMCMQV